MEKTIEVPVELEYVGCDLCGSSRTAPFLKSLDRNMQIHSGTPNATMSGQPWYLVRCQDCNLVFLNPRPVGSSLVNYYPNTYYAYNSPNRRVIRGVKSSIKRFVRRHRYLYNLLGRLRDGFEDPIVKEVGWVPPGAILDVGCGSGNFLDLVSDFGWCTFGVDISEGAVNEVGKKGHKVWLGDITELELPERAVDVVHMSHVLEHTKSPRRAIQAVKKVLRPEGILFIKVPNIGSILCEAFKDYSASLDLPRHLYQFTGGTLSRLVTEMGFQIVNIKTEAVPIYTLQSIALSLLDHNARIYNTEEFDIHGFLKNDNFHRALIPFCSELEKVGQGNNLRLLAKCVK